MCSAGSQDVIYTYVLVSRYIDVQLEFKRTGGRIRLIQEEYIKKNQTLNIKCKCFMCVRLLDDILKLLFIYLHFVDWAVFYMDVYDSRLRLV